MLARRRAIRKVIKKNREMYSMRSDFALKLGVAQRFKDEDRIYFPHNMDFRLVYLYISLQHFEHRNQNEYALDWHHHIRGVSVFHCCHFNQAEFIQVVLCSFLTIS